jgi:hypothetical protein
VGENARRRAYHGRGAGYVAARRLLFASFEAPLENVAKGDPFPAMAFFLIFYGWVEGLLSVAS